MSLRGRLANLEKLRGGSDAPLIIWYLSGDHPPPSEEEKRSLLAETLQRRPGQSMYTITWPPQERGEDAP